MSEAKQEKETKERAGDAKEKTSKKVEARIVSSIKWSVKDEVEINARSGFFF